jgi:pilus assembly protein CpaB
VSNKLALVVAVILGLVAVFGIHKYLQTQEKEYKTTYRSVAVAAARERIKAGTEIQPDMLGAIEMPETGVSNDHILKNYEAQLIGQTINRNVERRDPLLWSYFRQPVERLQDKLGPEQRALTLRVDAVTGVAGNIVPGSHVDILGTFGVRKPGKAGGGPALSASPETETVMVLNDVRILAVDTRTREVDYVTQAGTRRRSSYSTVTVAVTPEEASVLVFAQDYGTLTLVLRSPADTDVGPPPADVNDINLKDRMRAVLADRQERLRNRPLITVESD